MSKTKVCVVIPVYNGRRIVDKCINALLNQSRKPDKIICVDDASPDNSSKYIIEKFPSVKVIKNKCNIGASGTYAKGIKWAYKNGCDYIWLLDQDDIPFKDALENILKLQKGSNSTIFTSTLINPQTRTIYRMLAKHSIELDRPYEAEVVDFAGMLLSRAVIKKVGYPLKELTMDAADWEYCLRCRKMGYKIYVVPQSKVYHVGGKPKIVKLLTKKIHYRLVGKKIVRISSKYGVTRVDPPKRYYTRIKNTILVMKLPYATNFFRKFALMQIFKQFFKIILYEDDKARKIVAFLQGFVDGFLRRLE